MDFFFVIWGGIVALFIFRMVRHIYNAKKLRKEGIRTIGIVIGSKIRWGRITSVHPQIQFSTPLGEIIEVEGHTGIAIPMYSKGEKVIIYYDANNPKNFTLDSDFERASPYLVIFLIGIMLVIFMVNYITE